MPKRADELSAAEVRRLQKKPAGLYPVGGVAGLALRVTESGAGSWILRTMSGDKRRDFGLGGFPTVTLEKAREKAREARELIQAGTDPAEQRRAAQDTLRAASAKRRTFDEVARDCHAAKAPGFKNAKHAAQWISTLEEYAFPQIGALTVDAIELAHVLNVLQPIWVTKTETATRVRSRIETVLDYAKVKKLRRGENPALWKGNLDQVLAKPSKVRKVEHHPALPYDALPDFMAELRKREGMGALALEFAILTAARSGEVRLATWSEIDLDGKEWAIPAARMKADKEHRVPLSAAALAILKAVPRMHGSEFVFPAIKGGTLSDATLSEVIKRMHESRVKAGEPGYIEPSSGRVVVPHGFRSTFRDWVAERTNYANEVAEKALAHEIDNKTESAYRRGELFEKRRRLMADWARACAMPAKAATVTPIRTKGATR